MYYSPNKHKFISNRTCPDISVEWVMFAIK